MIIFNCCIDDCVGAVLFNSFTNDLQKGVNCPLVSFNYCVQVYRVLNLRHELHKSLKQLSDKKKARN